MRFAAGDTSHAVLGDVSLVTCSAERSLGVLSGTWHSLKAVLSERWAGQVEAIRAGVQPGLTMVVGPPGTGKTDTAVQIMHVLYHNCPSQRTLLITHSNQARTSHASGAHSCCFFHAKAGAREVVHQTYAHTNHYFLCMVCRPCSVCRPCKRKHICMCLSMHKNCQKSALGIARVR